MAMTMHVDVVSAEEAIFSGPAKMLFAPGVMGDLGIMPRHAPLLTRIKPGEVRVLTPDDEEQFYYVSGGMLEIQPDAVTILAERILMKQPRWKPRNVPKRRWPTAVVKSITRRQRQSWQRRLPSCRLSSV